MLAAGSLAAPHRPTKGIGHRCAGSPSGNHTIPPPPNDLPELSEAKVIDTAEKKAKEQTGR